MVEEQNTTALKFLKAAALDQLDGFQPHIGKNTRVLVFGGGNVAFDAARTAVRLGARVSVVCLESREKMLADGEEIEQAQEEGVKVYSGFTNSGFNVENGRATGLNVVAVSSFPVDPKTGKSGNKTSVDGVFTAGDVVTGTKAVIDAIAGGRSAAELIDAYLGGNGNIEEHLVDVPPADPHIGKIEGFAALDRVKPDILPCEKRRDSFDRVDSSFTEEAAQAEAARCLKCPLRCQLDREQMWTAYVK